MAESSAAATSRPCVVVAGSGVGAVETVLALRALAGDLMSIALVSPDEEFSYRPLAVVEPFGLPAPSRLPLSRLTTTHGVRHRRDALARVDAERHRVTLSSGDDLDFSALVVATGARPSEWLSGALTFGGEEDVPAYRALLSELEDGTTQRVLFVVPPGAVWTLPLYELALLTAAWTADRGVIGAELTIATPTHDPLALFGPAAARMVRDLFGNRGIHLLTDAQVTSLREGGAVVGGKLIDADRVVTLPELTGSAPPDLPADASGFIPTDDRCEVIGLRDVYAVGDVSAFPIKQGSLAAEQADAAAATIAARLGAPVEPATADRMVRAVLLTGVTAMYLRADLSAASGGPSTVTSEPLWWPPEKIAGRYLAPYLAEQHDLAGIGELSRHAAGPDAAQAREEQRELALSFAHSDAQWGDYHSALRWLQILEWLDGALVPEHRELRERWEQALQS
jgi:sulfide:quinone oxidoreductase